jgi:hypothetical protein
MDWQKGDVINIYDESDRSEEYVWVLEISTVKMNKTELNWYKVYNVRYGTTYQSFLDVNGSSLIYALISRRNDQI